MKSIATMIDEVNITGNVVVARMAIVHILKESNVKVYWTIVGRLVKKLCFVQGPINYQLKSYASYRTRSIREYLVALDKDMKVMTSGDIDYVFIFTDESQVHINHSKRKAYGKVGETSGMKKKTGKGRRLIILHTIGVGMETKIPFPLVIL